MTGNDPTKVFTPGQGYTQEDRDAIDSPELTDDEMARMVPARDILSPAFFERLDEVRRSRGRPKIADAKVAVTLRMDPDVLDRLKASDPDWRRRVNDALRAGALEDAVRETLPPDIENPTVTVGTRSASRIVGIRTIRGLSEDEKHAIEMAAFAVVDNIRLDFSVEA
jgi:uncharacterized protein (DUF4415 family)